MSNANVNNADKICWFTALHLIALPARNEVEGEIFSDLRCQIAELLAGSLGPISPNLDYQDCKGNTPLHYAVQLDTHEASEVVGVFLEKGADPNICNERNQSPLHLLCHNSKLCGQKRAFLETLSTMLMHSTDPNRQSQTGCTPLHLSLFHRNVDSACHLVQKGAELHGLWRKPHCWEAFWDDKGLAEVLALDMVVNDDNLFRILSSITKPSSCSWQDQRLTRQKDPSSVLILSANYDHYDEQRARKSIIQTKELTERKRGCTSTDILIKDGQPQKRQEEKEQEKLQQEGEKDDNIRRCKSRCNYRMPRNYGST